jgi:hypothetical protein
MANWTAKVLLEVATQDPTDKREGYTIRVLQWLKDDEPAGRPQLSKQALYLEGGEVKVGKNKGIRPEEFETILAMADEIRGSFGSSSTNA